MIFLALSLLILERVESTPGEDHRGFEDFASWFLRRQMAFVPRTARTPRAHACDSGASRLPSSSVHQFHAGLSGALDQADAEGAVQ
jgi:hypothetical protein